MNRSKIKETFAGGIMLKSPTVGRSALDDPLLWTIFGGILLAAVLFVPPRCSQADEQPAVPRSGQQNHQPQQDSRPQPRITVSQKTTRILEPLDKNGFVDYRAALNRMDSKDMTPENNAAVLFVRALGPGNLKPERCAEFCKLLQIELLPVRGGYLTSFKEFAQTKLKRPPTKKELADFDRAQQEPWSARDIPLVADWLKANEQPLELVVEGTRRSKSYHPLVESEERGLIGVVLPVIQTSREAARGLAARAMLRLGDGKIDEAEQDLLACHRLARLIARAPFVISNLVGIALDVGAFNGDARLIEYGHLTAERALAYQRELGKLAPFPAMADVVDKYERFMILDTMSILAREGSNAVKPVEVPGLFQRNEIEDAVSHRLAIDWDDVLAFVNEQIDRVIAAARLPNVPERNEAFFQLAQERRHMLAELRQESFSDYWATALPERSSRRMGKLLYVLLIPNVQNACALESRGHSREALEQVGFALAAYHAEHSAYPDSLIELVPKYISQLPNDPTAKGPLRYGRHGDGFLLYSVGPNGVDDEGRTLDSLPPADDVVLRIPHQSRKTP